MTMKCHGVPSMARLTSFYGSWPHIGIGLRSKYSSPVLCRLHSSINMKLYHKKIGFKLFYPRALHVISPHVGNGLYDINTYELILRLKKSKNCSDITKNCNIDKTVEYVNEPNIKTKAAASQVALCKDEEKSILKIENNFGRKLLELVEPFLKAVTPSPDDIQVKLNYKNDTCAIHDKYPMEYVFPTTFISTIAVPFENYVSKSSNKNEMCNSYSAANSLRLYCDKISVLKDNADSSLQNNTDGVSVRNGHVLHTLSTSPLGEDSSPPQKSKQNNPRMPSEEQLNKIADILNEELPRLFSKPMNYSIYTSDVVFENRIRGTCTVGIYAYIRQLAILKIIGHLRFAYVKLQILNLVKHPKDGIIEVRWRIYGSPILKSLPFLFTLKSYSVKSAQEKMDTWYDGVSTFYINEKALIYKHVVDDKMVNREVLKNDKLSILARLAALLGLHLQSPVISESAAINGVTHIDPKKPALIPLLAARNQ